MLEFTDVNIRTDVCNGVPQMARFCPELSGEADSSGFGSKSLDSNHLSGSLCYLKHFEHRLGPAKKPKLTSLLGSNQCDTS